MEGFQGISLAQFIAELRARDPQLGDDEMKDIIEYVIDANVLDDPDLTEGRSRANTLGLPKTVMTINGHMVLARDRGHWGRCVPAGSIKTFLCRSFDSGYWSDEHIARIIKNVLTKTDIYTRLHGHVLGALYTALARKFHRCAYVIAECVPLHAVDESNDTALHIALGSKRHDARFFDRAAAECLINRYMTEDTSLDAKNNMGCTPLAVAVKTMVPESVVKLLVRAGARVDTYDNHGLTPLLRMVMRDGVDFDIATLLPSVNPSAYINYMHDNEFTALDLAAAYCHLRWFNHMVRCGALDDAQNAKRTFHYLIDNFSSKISTDETLRQNWMQIFNELYPKLAGDMQKAFVEPVQSVVLGSEQQGKDDGKTLLELIRAANVPAGLLYDAYEAGEVTESVPPEAKRARLE